MSPGVGFQSVASTRVKSAFRRREPGLGMSDRFVRVFDEESDDRDDLEGADIEETVGERCGTLTFSSVSLSNPLKGSPASGQFASQGGGWQETIADTLVSCLRAYQSAACLPAELSASAAVRLLEDSVEAGAMARRLALAQAFMAHASAAVRATSIIALEEYLPAFPHLRAQVFWLKQTDPSSAVRAVAGEVLDSLE